MDHRLLRYFVACVESRTMHAAARAVNVSQPALSKAIANLEQELGVALLDRQPRGVTATPYGETLFRYAKMIDSELRRAVAEIDAMRGMTRGTIVVGVVPSMAEALGRVAQQVIALHPGLKLKMRVAFSAELSPALLNGELDFAMMLLSGDVGRLGIVFEPLVSTGPVVVVSAGHPLARDPEVTLQKIGQFPWLIPEYPPSHREIVSRAFIDAGLPPPRAALEVSTVIFFSQLLRDSDLVTVAPSTMLDARAEDSKLVALPIDFDFPPENLGLAFRENSTLLPGARAVATLIREMCSTLPRSLQSR